MKFKKTIAQTQMSPIYHTTTKHPAAPERHYYRLVAQPVSSHLALVLCMFFV